jgi:hypothetical protein
LAKQLREKVLLLFTILHPGCQALIMFGNSQNHHALPPHALNAKVLTIKDGRKNIKPQRNGWFIRNGQKCVQPMQDAQGVQKGFKTILAEHGLWDNCLSLWTLENYCRRDQIFERNKSGWQKLCRKVDF